MKPANSRSRLSIGDFGWFQPPKRTENLNNQFYSGLTKPLELGRHYPPGIFAVRLTSGRPTAAVHLRLGPKAGVLFGTVTDAKSGFPLNPCAELKRANTRNSYINGTGLLKAHYRLLIPSNTDINLKVWLTGYKLWYFPGTSEAAANKALRMSPAQEIRLDIQLEPDATATGNRDCGMPVGKTEP